MKPHRETDKFTTYKIANIRKFNPKYKTRSSQGKTIIASFWKDKPYKISFTKFSYHVNNKVATTIRHSTLNFCLSYKNGSLNFYSITKNTDGSSKVSNRSCNSNLFTLLRLEKTSHAKNLARVINIFLKQNKIKPLLPIQKINKNNFGEYFCHLLYPGARGILRSMPRDLSKFFRHSKPIKQVIKQIFGFNGKKITKLICERSQRKGFDGLESCFYYGLIFKGFIPVDRFYPILENTNIINKISFLGQDIRPTDIRRFLRKRTKTQQLSLINDMTRENFGSYLFWDTVREDRRLEKRNCAPQYSIDLRTWQEFHDVLFPPYRPGQPHRIIPGLLEPDPEEEIIFEYSDKLKGIDNSEVDDMKIILPTSSRTLIDWSNKMRNCVRTYSQLIKKNYSTVLGILKNNELKYNVEIRGREVTQFYGKGNALADINDKKKIIDFLKEKEIIKGHTDDATDFAVRAFNIMNQEAQVVPF